MDHVDSSDPAPRRSPERFWAFHRVIGPTTPTPTRTLTPTLTPTLTLTLTRGVAAARALAPPRAPRGARCRRPRGALARALGPRGRGARRLRDCDGRRVAAQLRHRGAGGGRGVSARAADGGEGGGLQPAAVHRARQATRQAVRGGGWLAEAGAAARGARRLTGLARAVPADAAGAAGPLVPPLTSGMLQFIVPYSWATRAFYQTLSPWFPKSLIQLVHIYGGDYHLLLKNIIDDNTMAMIERTRYNFAKHRGANVISHEFVKDGNLITARKEKDIGDETLKYNVSKQQEMERPPFMYPTTGKDFCLKVCSSSLPLPP